MPEGGRTLVLAAFGENPDRIAEIASMEHNAEQWRELVEQAGADLTEVQILTLSSYLALNLPLAEPASLADLEPAGLTNALPPDGKDLAVKHCQACHSFFTGYLTHDRDKTGWMQTFQSPFHQEIPMSRTEIETFARYSELNMPMSYEDVPAEWRF